MSSENTGRSTVDGDNSNDSEEWNDGRYFVLEMEIFLFVRESCFCYDDHNRPIRVILLPACHLVAKIAGAEEKSQATAQTDGVETEVWA